MVERRIASEYVRNLRPDVVQQGLEESRKQGIPMAPVVELGWTTTTTRFEEFKQCYEDAVFISDFTEGNRFVSEYCVDALEAASQFQKKYRAVLVNPPISNTPSYQIIEVE